MKTGIITFFYNSVNYGDALQAYALTRCLNSSSNVDARQIYYREVGGSFSPKTSLKRRLLKALNPGVYQFLWAKRRFKECKGNTP